MIDQSIEPHDILGVATIDDCSRSWNDWTIRIARADPLLRNRAPQRTGRLSKQIGRITKRPR